MTEPVNILTSQDFIDTNEKVTIVEETHYYVKPHLHDFIEIAYIRDGSGVHIINGQRYSVSAGDMLFINYGQTHEIIGDPSMKLVNFLFTPEFISNSLLNTENISDVFAFTLSGELDQDFSFSLPIARFNSSEHAELQAITNAMLKEYRKKNHGYRSMLKAYMQLIFCMLVRNVREQDNTTPTATLHKITPEILHYIDINCFDKLKLRSLAEKCFYTPSYFSRLFKETCGKSLTEYIKEKRISEASRLLAETALPITKISEIVGYQDRKLFNKFFKQITGMTPSDYRKHHNIDSPGMSEIVEYRT